MTLLIKTFLGMIALVFSFQSMANDWSWYHGDDNGTRYSTLDQINKSNIGDLNVAWIHQPGAIEQGLEATPVVIDGVMYYAGSYNRTFAIDAATGKELWHYFPDLDPIVDELFFTPYTRGVTVSNGNVTMGTLDGRAIALDQKTGKEVWSVQLVDTTKCACNFTSPPVMAGNTLVMGQTAGEYPIQGKVFGMDPKTGEVQWTFNTIKDDPASWGGDSGKYGGMIIIPSYDEDGVLNFFTGRSYYDVNFKHLNPTVSKDIVGFGLFVNWDLPITIVEGAFDAIAISASSG